MGASLALDGPPTQARCDTLFAVNEQANAFRRECESLDRFVSALSEEDWWRRTQFFAWSVADEIMHLHFIDRFAWLSLTDEAAFASTVSEVRAQQLGGLELSAQMRERYGNLSKQSLLAEWRALYERMHAQFSHDNPKRRIPWFGPDMSVRSCASARQMEVWAHGQDVYDLFAVRRVNSDDIRNICELGVRTFAWSFQNRREPVPREPPRVALVAPSGAGWEWNDDAAQSISGGAEDFALVVTQRRNIADTELITTGDDAARWMQIAQCFAGPPETPPAAGVRASKAVRAERS